MADWATVRYDPAYEEPLDAEIVPLLDALNNAGFTTTSSCCGHGSRWGYVGIEWRADTEDGIERLARFIMARQDIDYHPQTTDFSKEIVAKIPEMHPSGYLWHMQLRTNNTYGDTPPAVCLAAMVVAINEAASLVREFAETGLTLAR